MSSIDHQELFEQYYQNEYDYNTASLSQDDIADIKKLAREKRVDYAQAPIGTGVFSWISKQNSNIRFELVPFESEKIDGMLYIPAIGKESAYIILNANKPLINQIFTSAHEYYHYVKDYQKFKDNPYICDFSMLKDTNEKKACRFAAELLLPEDALDEEVSDYCRTIGISDLKSSNFNQSAPLTIILTIKYQIPLKAVMYRLLEEHYIDSIDKFSDNYSFIKNALREIEILGKRVEELYSKENNYVLPYSATYQDMEKAFSTGNASKEDILKDAKKLNMNLDIIKDFLIDDETEDKDDDDELFSLINAKRR